MSSSIHDFEILSKLGEGSFSSVYKVKRKSDGKFYAMKKVKMSLLTLKEKENALNEIRILASLSSPYIVPFYDSFLDDSSNILCIIMELATGGDMTEVLKEGQKKGGVEEEEIWRALVHMCSGVKALHDLKILHRDLKLANVFVSKSDQGRIYKLGDLNISKVTKGANAKTQTGTPYYAAPEVWKGMQYSSPCDIWSMGCIIYELAAQKPPFRGGDLQQLNQNIQRGVFDPLPGKYSKDLGTIISSMLTLNPDKRPTVTQILNNPMVIKQSGSILIQQEVDGVQKHQLLQTIKLPKNLVFLKGNLPKAKYDDCIEYKSKARAISAGPRREEVQKVVEKEEYKKIEEPKIQVKQEQQQKQNKPPPMPPKQQQQQQVQKQYQQIKEYDQRLFKVQPSTPKRRYANLMNEIIRNQNNSNQKREQQMKQIYKTPQRMRRKNSAHQVGRR